MLSEMTSRVLLMTARAVTADSGHPLHMYVRVLLVQHECCVCGDQKAEHVILTSMGSVFF